MPWGRITTIAMAIAKMNDDAIVIVSSRRWWTTPPKIQLRRFVNVTINIRANNRGGVYGVGGLAVGKGEEVVAVAVRRAIESRRGKGGGRL